MRAMQRMRKLKKKTRYYQLTRFLGQSCILAIAIDMRPKRQIQTLCGGQSTVQEIILINNRARAYVELRDLTGSINATIIGEPAEKFLQCTADKLMQEDANPDILQVVRTTTGEDYILYVKALNNDPSVGQIKYEVVFILHPVSVQEMPTNTEMNSLENLLTTSKEIPNEENSKSVTIPVRRALILPQIKFDQNQKDKQKMYEDDDVFLHSFAETEIQTPAQTNKYDDFSDHEPCPKC
ncbi:Nucleic acid-binding [Forsythia ovata]|uniref:Nucleic acid-binding n=1 Tax=Forsythia ovata TaxID=205694 RepID=A0ABD1SNE6_9LAMI